jgi:hypothetical protein
MRTIGASFYPDRTDTQQRSKEPIINRQTQLPAEALGTSPCRPKIFRKGVRKAIINGVK